MMRLWLVVTFALVSVAASVLGISASLADPCAAVRSQLAPSGRSGGISSELAQLRRQLAAIQGLERQRRCTAQSAVGGFFNACADLAKSRTQVQRQIAGAAISRRDASGLQARLVALGCTPAAGQQRQRPAGAMIGSNSMLFCVRLSDGYFFPAPKSQFVQGGDVKEMVDQCRYICDDAGVDLYMLSDPSLETEEMVALDTRTSYKDLPTAFKYRDDANFRACDLKRYHRRVAELRARTVTPANMANAIIPLPSAKPDLGTVAQLPQPGADAAEARGAAQRQSVEPLAGSRPVRVVGPAFFPAE
ncbi:DUF2865 domain-containing protein [Mesorhizobium sp. RSR380A]|uniref:DUF2865 domain-containing protein n=1 Tax=Mesorhizobium sp. LNJC380A00 TaxID=1287264 RepID=UPI0003CE9ED9|nr:DUF2865 domain-containing protein [Mesorhizobium sp. LNJC380A00]ESY48307.1 hypothetical protein X746_07015 [Mesorhizobium sp. LNJC380A00]